MNQQSSLAIYEYFSQKKSIFSVDVFLKDMRAKNVKLSRTEALDLLHSSNNVFTLINEEFVTRAGVFTNHCFSIKPSKEEIKKDRLIIGHRCMPFVNPDISPDDIRIVVDDKIIPPTKESFSMNLALDTYSFFGEGYVLPCIINDKANDDFDLKSVVNSLPNQIKLTCWPLSQIAGKKVKYGDRLLCKVVEWEGYSKVEMILLEKESDGLQLTTSDIQREKWYKSFEKGMLASFDKNGPLNSIEEQLALLFLEHQEELCIVNCGSSEEFLSNTDKIGFSQYGVESRIWKTNEIVPFVGEWNKQFSKDLILLEISQNFSPHIIDSYLRQNLYNKNLNKPFDSVEDLFCKIFPFVLGMSADEQKILLADIKKRNAFLEKSYDFSMDKSIFEIRERALSLFSKVNLLISSIGNTKLDVEKFPQFELVVLTQLYSHLVKLIEEVENIMIRLYFPTEDVMLSLSGMEETFEDVQGAINFSKNKLLQECFKLV